MSLTSGARITCRAWTELPIPTDVINRINKIGSSQGMPSMITYANRKGEEIVDTIHDYDNQTDIDNSTYGSLSSQDEESLYFDDPETNEEGISSVSSSMSSSSNINQQPEPTPVIHDDRSSNSTSKASHFPDTSSNGSSDDEELILSDTTYHFENIEITGVGEETHETPTDTIETTGVDGQDNETTAPDSHSGRDDDDNNQEPTKSELFQQAEDIRRMQTQDPNHRLPRQKITVPREQDFIYHTSEMMHHLIQGAHLYHNIPEETFFCAMAPHADELMTFLTKQMTAKKGSKMFGDRGIAALEKELRQLLYREVMHPVNIKSLTREQKLSALRYLMFLKEKRSGEVKGTGCADGRKQRVYKTKEETHAPTVSMEAMFITAIFNAMEGRDVAIVDIPGAFMQAEIDKLIHVKLDGELVDLLVKLDPKYAQYITYEQGRKVIYTELDKALYGTLQAALLFWKKLSSILVDQLGFTINPYNSCVANKQIDGKQFTICWHVDDLKLSHKSSKIVTDIINKLQQEYGKETPLTVKQGKVFDDYLGMKMDFSVPGKVIFSMIEYIEQLISETPD